MKGKNARKRAIRTAGPDGLLVAEKLRERRHKYSAWFASLGGPEALASFHRSAIVGAKPIRKGRITAPDNPLNGCLIQEYVNFFCIFIPKHSRNERVKTERAGIAHMSTKFGGLYLPKIGYIFPKHDNESIGFVRRLSVRWG